MRLFVFPIFLIPLAIAILVGGGAVLGLHGLTITKGDVLAAESTYGTALSLADGYINACRAGHIPNCTEVMKQIQTEVKVTDALYQQVLGLEDNPPKDIASQFITAVGVLQKLTPAIGG